MSPSSTPRRKTRSNKRPRPAAWLAQAELAPGSAETRRVELVALGAPRDRDDLEALVRILVGHLASPVDDVRPEQVPFDTRCGFVGDRSGIWSWAEPLGDRRPRFVVVGDTLHALSVVDILGQDPQAWPRREIEAHRS
ncbi:MAG: hypothetical protein ABIJ09_09060 [Pseudomonadota bacterium]